MLLADTSFESILGSVVTALGGGGVATLVVKLWYDARDRRAGVRATEQKNEDEHEQRRLDRETVANQKVIDDLREDAAGLRKTISTLQTQTLQKILAVHVEQHEAEKKLTALEVQYKFECEKTQELEKENGELKAKLGERS
jgi:septal ring factor EnvC (AmiA/AmiB activator)